MTAAANGGVSANGPRRQTRAAWSMQGRHADASGRAPHANTADRVRASRPVACENAASRGVRVPHEVEVQACGI
ncbi:hypothetical protein LA76x_2437 [Lysobacter antibioticus]|uniref:Uncharacterized protein n=1 Tax=Lysobacter antibioticus TaxID=84531 RepID=A0A0S2FAK1_LYSAN|nr:hypothetical protein LA76x_2437 [Lysobacter antibioticus]